VEGKKVNDMTLISAREVSDVLRMNIKTFYGFLKRPAGASFPKPISFGKRTNRWRKMDVERWISDRAQEAADA
jgi:predicted DNA-binding transcriptional regulator AlpA